MKAVLLLVAAASAFAQTGSLSPAAEFDLFAGHKAHHGGRSERPYFSANPNGLTLIAIGDGTVLLVSTDLKGRIRQSTTDLASVHARIDTALPRPDGSFWLVSSGPYSLLDTFTQGPKSIPNPPYGEIDLYSPTAAHLTSVRLQIPAGGWDTPIAAAQDQLVLRTDSRPGFAEKSQLIRFGTVVDSSYKERAQVRLAPPVFGAIPLLTGDGNLLLIDKASGNMLVIDPQSRQGSVLQAATPHPVRAAAIDADHLYLLSGGTVLKTDRSGRVLATYRFQFHHGFAPESIGVTGNALYLLDRSGHVEQFQLD